MAIQMAVHHCNRAPVDGNFLVGQRFLGALWSVFYAENYFVALRSSLAVLSSASVRTIVLLTDSLDDEGLVGEKDSTTAARVWVESVVPMEPLQPSGGRVRNNQTLKVDIVPLLYFVGIESATKGEGQSWLVHHVNIPMVLYSASRNIGVVRSARNPPHIVAPFWLECEYAGAGAASRLVLNHRSGDGPLTEGPLDLCWRLAASSLANDLNFDSFCEETLFSQDLH